MTRVTTYENLKLCFKSSFTIGPLTAHKPSLHIVIYTIVQHSLLWIHCWTPVQVMINRLVVPLSKTHRTVKFTSSDPHLFLGQHCWVLAAAGFYNLHMVIWVSEANHTVSCQVPQRQWSEVVIPQLAASDEYSEAQEAARRLWDTKWEVVNINFNTGKLRPGFSDFVNNHRGGMQQQHYLMFVHRSWPRLTLTLYAVETCL